MTKYWRKSNLQCESCECDSIGSEVDECDDKTGVCVCKDGFGGDKCDDCADGSYGMYPDCKDCGKCFHDWDKIINDLEGNMLF